MLQDALLAYLHFISIIATIATVGIEAALCRPGLTKYSLKLLGRVDLVYLVAALLAVTTGLLRAFFGIKGWMFYQQNPVFWIKISLFVAVGLISILPTIRFIRWGKHLAADAGAVLSQHEIAGTARFIYIELLLLALIPLCASLMARGFGY